MKLKFKDNENLLLLALCNELVHKAPYDFFEDITRVLNTTFNHYSKHGKYTYSIMNTSFSTNNKYIVSYCINKKKILLYALKL